MEPELVKSSNEHAQNTSEIKHEHETPFTEEKTRQVSSSSSSSSSSYPMEDHSDEKGSLHDNSPTKPELDANQSPSPKSVSSPFEPTEMKSPPIQTMGQPPGYDPNRIPASIFSTSKKGGPADWSATSNESLFSIHMGNSSFSHDYAILFGKSGELPKLEDWNGSHSNPFTMPGELPRLEEWSSTPPPSKLNEVGSLPIVLEAPSLEESSVLSGEFSKKEEAASPTFVSGQTMEINHGKVNVVSADVTSNVSSPAAAAAAKKPPLPETNSTLSNPMSFPSRLSDASVHSGSSFAFPVLGSHDSGKNESMKVVPEKPQKAEKAEQPEAQPQTQASQGMPLSFTGTRWFSCFSCWPRFC